MNQEQKNPDMDLIPVTELKDYQRAVVVKSPKYLPLEGKRIQCWKHSIVSFNEGDDFETTEFIFNIVYRLDKSNK